MEILGKKPVLGEKHIMTYLDIYIDLRHILHIDFSL